MNSLQRIGAAALFGVAALASPLRGAVVGMTLDEARGHWAFQPVVAPPVPTVRSADRVQTPVDAFVLGHLESRGLGLATPANPRDLLRRVYFDLVGLPPDPGAVDAFVRSPTPQALAAVVDRLLASPQYGERWGRHWLDVARYADTKDLVLVYGRDALRPYAYTYRDYVIRAFNEDLPFNEFVRDQIAADLRRPEVPPWRLAALGFLTLGRMFDNNPHDQIDDQIDTVSRGLLGMTVACARCHDHKYDAISSSDYYGLYGVFASTERPSVLPLIEDPETVPGGLQFERSLAAARKELEDHVDAEYVRLSGVLQDRLGDYLVRAATTDPDLSETAQFGLSLTPDDFRPSLVQRTRQLIARRAVPEDTVFGPWAQLLSHSEHEFAAGTVALEVPPSIQWNPLVVDALRRAAPTNRAAVARAYGELFQQVRKRNAPEDRHPATQAVGPAEREILEVAAGPGCPVSFPRRETPNHMSRPEKDRYGGLVMALDKLAAHATNRPPARAMVVQDLPEPYSPHVFLRGNPSRPGPAVPRGFLRVLNGGREQPFTRGSGRLELADAIVAPGNPLTARVFVNRVWMEHFGEPLVASPSDFGARSAPPAIPGLLDWLAWEFMRSGWSVKSLHRVLVLSAVYGQRSTEPDAGGSIPEAGLVSRRRLDLEAMRDSLLAVSGRLEFTQGGPSVDLTGDPGCSRRTVYGLIDRQNLPGFYRSFDFAAPDQCVERRPRTTVPQQALFALNSPFVLDQARALAACPEIEGEADPARRVAALFRRVLGRVPTDDELSGAVRFVTQSPDDGSRLTPWEQLGQMLMVSNEAVFLD